MGKEFKYFCSNNARIVQCANDGDVGKFVF
jgi:hypothetical protein